MLLLLSLLFYIFFFTNKKIIKISTDSSAKSYQNNKERLQKKSHEKYWSLSFGEREKQKVTIWVKKIYKSLWRWKTKVSEL